MNESCMHIKEDDSYIRQIAKLVYTKDTNMAIVKSQVRKVVIRSLIKVPRYECLDYSIL